MNEDNFHERTCPTCKGAGRIQGNMDDMHRCETCKGHGTVLIAKCRHCNGTGRDPHALPKARD